MPGVRCTRGCAKSTVVPQVHRSQPAFPAQWFYGFLRALPGDRLVCHRHQRDAEHHRQLDASVGASGPHDFAVRNMRRSSARAIASIASCAQRP
jgi:hypothetical protein